MINKIAKTIGSKANKGGTTVPSKQKIYAKIAMKSDDIVDGILELAKSKNENVRLGALKSLLNKIIPDLKSINTQEEEGKVLHHETPQLSGWLVSRANAELKEQYNLLAEKYCRETGNYVSKILELD